MGRQKVKVYGIWNWVIRAIWKRINSYEESGWWCFVLLVGFLDDGSRCLEGDNVTDGTNICDQCACQSKLLIVDLVMLFFIE